MKVDEDLLRGILREAIADINQKPRTMLNKVKNAMHNMYGITIGDSTNILSGKLPVELMQKDILFKVTNVLHEINKNTQSTFNSEKLNVNNYFTESEILELGQKIDRKEQEEDVIIEHGNWIQIEEDQYIIKISPNELMEKFVNKNKINYNPETQRDLTIKETSTGKVKMITFFSKAYEEIISAMENNLYISDMMALNINPDFYEPPKIIRDNLVISKESQIDCIDGFHRLKAAIATKTRKKDWDKPLTFYLFTYDVEKAVRYILQQDKKNHLSENQIVKSDTTDAANFITNKLNDSANFVFRNRIDETKRFILNKTIDKLFSPKKLLKPEDRQEAIKIYKIIEKNVNELVDHNNLYESEITTEMWFAWLFILKHCIDNNYNFIELINKTCTNDLLEKIKITVKPANEHFKIMKGAVTKNV